MRNRTSWGTPTSRLPTRRPMSARWGSSSPSTGALRCPSASAATTGSRSASRRCIWPTGSPEMSVDLEQRKLKVATTSLAGCFGCHMSFLDIDERLLDLLEMVEFDRSPLTDIKHCGPCDIGIVEGGICNAENIHVLREFRKN